MSRNSDTWQNHGAMAGRTEETKHDPPSQKEAELQAAELHQPQAEAREPEGHQVEEEQRKALEEEAMEQVGQAERLEEEHDPSPEEQDREWKEQREQREDGQEGHAQAEVRVHLLQVGSHVVSLPGMGRGFDFKEKSFHMWQSYLIKE